MAHAPKKRLLPKNITERPDAAIAERLFGKPAKRKLDQLVDAPKKPMNQS